MYDYFKGDYTLSLEKFQNEGLYQKESSYYLKFNSSKGLYAIKKLSENYKGNIEEKCFYYHIYLDLLFQSVGMIINRFKPQKKNGNIVLQAQKNCKQFNFDKDTYPLLNDKSFRNFIEHIDERDEILIDKKSYYGTFNMIYPKMDEEIRNGLLNDKRQQNNLLNLENMTYTILDIDKKNELNIVKKVIDLKELKKELTKINEISKKIWEYSGMRM